MTVSPSAAPTSCEHTNKASIRAWVLLTLYSPAPHHASHRVGLFEGNALPPETLLSFKDPLHLS
jgi:hypothetical protein